MQVILALLILLFPALLTAQPFDILITGGRVLDGTGNPSILADVGTRSGRIAAVGNLRDAPAARKIDARGRIVCPGFIDLHSHAEDGLGSDNARRRAALNLVTQGITTVVINPDGSSPWPSAAQRERLTRLGIGPNAVLMAGHGTVRGRAMGSDFKRAATAEEIRRTRDLVRQAMREGAFGLSAGLEYSPGIWSTTEELVSLVEEIAPFDGVYIVHQRSESSDPRWFVPSRDNPGQPTLLDAVQETIEIGERTGARVVATHSKVMGANYWGSSGAAIRLIERARSRGVDIWADQYPYNSTGGDGAMVLIPRWAIGNEDYPASLRRTMADPAKAEKARSDILHEMARRGGPENITLMDHPNRSFVGKSLDELATARGITPLQMALELQYEGYRDRPGGARLRGHSVWEPDIEAFMAKPWTATSTDAGIALPEDGPVHARFYGSYPRKIREYALDRKVVSLEDAIRTSTSLPAQILRLKDRGMIREGFQADVVVFDPNRIRDRATFFEPHQYPEGIGLVLVNGKPVVDDGKPTAALPGAVLGRQAAPSPAIPSPAL